jgi:two-component system C4-dicarboxylate transport sensor histidine kinase DctB
VRILTYIASVLAILIVAIGIFWVSRAYFQSEELSKAEGRLSLYESTVSAEFERFSHLTYVLARDPFVIDTAINGDTSTLNPRLAEFAQRAGLDAIYLMDTTGLTIAASNFDTDASFVGQNYGFRPYFQVALSGEQGRFYAIGSTTGIPGYFIADAVTDAGGNTVGVVAIKIELFQLEQSWKQSGEHLFLANHDGVILLSSDPSWRYKTTATLSEDQRRDIEVARQFSGQPLVPLDWRMLTADRAEVNGAEWLHLTSETLPHGWRLHYFASDDRAVSRSWLVTAIAVALAALAFIFFQTQRARRVGAALARSERNEAELRQANERLAVEIDERITAERRLKRTQNELERAGRLAALGQLAASVTHELGQPIAAMKNHLAAAEIQSGTTKLTDRLQGLVDRMEGITRQLKFFARQGKDNFERVDLRDAMQAALDLVDPNISLRKVTVHRIGADEPVPLTCNKLRIEQVMTNLLRNALDAVEDTPSPEIAVSFGQSHQNVWFSVADNGHGLGGRTLSELSEPFTTTRESGQGMGLGLAISAAIVNDHNGHMTATDNPDGGTVFTVSFPAGTDE